jgi:hypothetical protein
MVMLSIYKTERYSTAAKIERRQKGEDIGEIRDWTVVWTCIWSDFDGMGVGIWWQHVIVCTR